ncbi:MAG TPA: hypothetical protein VJ302_03135 [Blastocatellia bacterium]|nr:hypothetical protein [Blastocatellia bacterium]
MKVKNLGWKNLGWKHLAVKTAVEKRVVNEKRVAVVKRRVAEDEPDTETT